MKLLVFDGNSIINRAFYAISSLTTKDGRPTNALYGFLKLYFKYFNMSQPDMVAVAFDVRAKTFRHELCCDYKAQRKGMPDELAEQMQPLKDILSAMNVKIFECEGFEADDIIGTLALYCDNNGYDCDIVSGDRDDFQLVTDKVKVIMPVTRGGMSEVEIYDKAAITDKYGFEPPLIVDLKAIMGDSSDNIKGVAGIGEKGATELVREYGSLENIYQNLEKIKPALCKKLEADKQSAFLSKTLATIKKDVPIEIDNSQMLVKAFDEDALCEILEGFELTSILKQLGIEKKTKQVLEPDVFDAKEQDIYEFAKKNGMYFLFDGNAYYVMADGGVARLESCDALLLDGSIDKYTFDSKRIYKPLLLQGKSIKPFYDIALCEYVIDPSAKDYLPENIIFKYLETTAKTTACQVICLKEVCDLQKSKLDSDGQTDLLFNIELPLALVLADMENTGFAVDRAALEKFSQKLEGNIKDLENRIYFLAGETFNINSPKQLGVVLFEKLGLPHGKKTKTGYSTGADILQKLSGRHEIIDEILEYRQYVKLKSTYCDGLLKLIDQNGRIHTSFNQTVTTTGRISSTEPNLQNIPVRTALGSRLREMFVSDDGKVLIDADYSQIELRVLAHIANDKAMLEAFANDEDIHTVTASSVFSVPADFVTPQMRRAAKAVNFGIVYGISDFSLAQDIKTTKAEAKRYIDSYLELYSGVHSYMQNIVETAKQNGYVTTLLGRRRYLPELASSNFIQRSFGERAAMNAPIQGSAADIIKIAMVNTYKALLEGGYKSKIILQVHDELIIEAPENEKNAVIKILTEQMENALYLNVHLKVDAAWGRTWLECK